MGISKLEGLQVSVKEEVIIKVLLEILYKQGYISNICYFKSIDMLKDKNCEKISWNNLKKKYNFIKNIVNLYKVVKNTRGDGYVDEIFSI